jgi:ribosomal protein S21
MIVKKKKNKDDIKKQPANSRVEGEGIAVKVINGNIELALKILKHVVKDSGMVDELRYRQEFHKKSAVKREMRKAAIRKQQIESRFNDF